MFQLTASRGGWRGRVCGLSIITRCFNSQPHEEADRIGVIGCAILLLFQLTASRGGWHQFTKSVFIQSMFQLTASRGGWQPSPLLLLLSFQCFNSQPHEEADGNFEQKYLLRNCIFYNYCIYYFLYLSCIQLFMHFFSLNLPIFRCECPRESCVLSFRTYNIKVSVTSKPGLAPICSILFLYFSPK